MPRGFFDHSHLKTNRTCDIEGCNGKHYAKGLCGKCYRAKYKKEHYKKLKEKAKKYRDTHKEEKRQYWKKNKKRLKKLRKAYCKKNKARVLKLAKAHRLKNRVKIKEQLRNGDLKRHYNINLEDYDKLLKEQNCRCAICGITPKEQNNKDLAVDHCHKTKKIRGLLCSKCNFLIGHADENIEILQSAINYLERSKI